MQQKVAGVRVRACLPGIPSVLQSASSDCWPKAVYAPRGAKFYELALVAIAFDPHGRRLQASSAATTRDTKNNHHLGEQVLHAQPHAYER